jgi:hypothetical protein
MHINMLNFVTWIIMYASMHINMLNFFKWVIMCEFMHNNVIKTFHMNGSMHINWSYDQIIIKIQTLIKLQT